MPKNPLVTYAGDSNLFHSLQVGLASSLTQENVEWRRSYGRPNRSVHIEVDFVSFSEDSMKREHERSILGYPIFHTYWTDCPDLDSYKGSVREDLQSWIHKLRANAKSDWMIILVETPDTKKTNKLLPRTTVLDKLKSDFGGKHSERCIALINPSKSDSRSVDSWQMLMSKMRQLIMVAYNRALNKFEEYMRSERERRGEKGWSFFSYFLLQEELALVYNLLGLYDEALVQYDELDALITQFVKNSVVGDVPQWLLKFSEPCERWEGLSLIEDRSRTTLAQKKIKEGSTSLLEFRNYLFKCQASLLIEQNKPWELASRALTFLQNTITEFRILDGCIMNGGLSCWGFLSCFEVIHFLTKFKNSSTTDLYALHTAPLWSYARDKLKELRRICGLLPGISGHGDHLHLVVTLVCGMGDDPHLASEETNCKNSDSAVSPMSRLKDALSSPEAFKKHFLDLSEVAISTHKHIGRLRTARLIGMDLADYYIEEGNKQLASTFLSDQLKTFLVEGWHVLATNAQKKLANCYEATGDLEKYIRTCLHLSTSPSFGSATDRVVVFDDFVKASKQMSPDALPLAVSTDRLFEIGWMKVISESPIILGCEVKLEVIIISKLPSSMQFDLIQVQLRLISDHCKKNDRSGNSPHTNKSKGGSDIERKQGSFNVSPQGSSRKQSSFNRHQFDNAEGSFKHSRRRSSSTKETINEDPEGDAEKESLHPFLKPLNMEFHLDYKQDGSLATAYVNCKNLHKALRRDDSLGGIMNLDMAPCKEDFTDCVVGKDITINPGRNVIHLKTKVCKNGLLKGGQIVLVKDKLEFICNLNLIRSTIFTLVVVSEKARVFLARKERELLAGVLQPLILTIKSGSSKIEEGTKIHLRCSRGLSLKWDKTSESKEHELGNGHGGNELDIVDKLGSVSLDGDHKTNPSEDVSMSESLLSSEIVVTSPEIAPFTSATLQLETLADLIPQKDTSTIEHNVSINSSFLEETRVDIDLNFLPPFVVSHKLQTAHLSKFIQVSISGLVKRMIELKNAKLTVKDKDHCIPLKYLNSANQKMVVSADQSANCVWELPVDYSSEEMPILKAVFSVDHRLLETKSEEITRTFQMFFDIQNYKTLFTIHAKVEPMKGTEFCRAGTMCHLSIIIERLTELCKISHEEISKNVGKSVKNQDNTQAVHNIMSSIMYEVLSDQAMWAVCDRTSGVLCYDSEKKQTVILDVMPLVGGFLPLPSVRLSKYIPADSQMSQKDTKSDLVGSASSVPRLEPFKPGQVYNFSKALQVHVLPST